MRNFLAGMATVLNIFPSAREKAQKKSLAKNELCIECNCNPKKLYSCRVCHGICGCEICGHCFCD